MPLLALLCLLFLLPPAWAAAPDPAPNFARQAALPRWAELASEIPATTRTDPVVLRLAEIQVDLSGEPVVLVNRAIQVNSSAALASIGQIEINYVPAYEKLTLHRVSILRNGQRIDHLQDASLRRLQREAGFETGVYGGAESVQLLLNDVRVGDTLWLSYSISGFNPVFEKRWHASFGWDGDAPIELRRIHVAYPAQRKLQWQLLGEGGPQPRETVDGKLRHLRFEERGLAAIAAEPYVPSDVLQYRMLVLSEYANWGEVAAWAARLFPPAARHPAVEGLARTLAPQGSPAERAAAALHWVQQEVRYFSVALSENSHRPQAPEQVLKRRYGDCKDKSYLLVSLLGAMGIEAEPLLVSARAPALPAKVLATPMIFDHAIVRLRIDGQNHFVDPTLPLQPVGLASLPRALPGAAALPVSASALLPIPPETHSAPRMELIEHLRLTGLDGPAELDTERRYRGAWADNLRRVFAGMSAVDRRNFFLERYEKTYPGAQLIGEPEVVEDGKEDSLGLKARLQLPSALVAQDGGGYRIAVETRVLEGAMNFPEKLSRKHPVQLAEAPYGVRYRLQVDYPAAVEMWMNSARQEIDNPSFSAVRELVAADNHTELVLDFRLKQAQASAPALPALHADVQKLARLTSLELTLPAGAIATGKAQGLPPRLVDALNTHTLEQEESKALSAARCKDWLAAWAARGLTRASVYPVLNALEKKVESGKANPIEQRCQAQVLYAVGDGDAALRLGAPLTGVAEALPLARQLAWLRLYRGQAAEAVADLEKAAVGQSDMLLDADRIALHQHAGLALPPALLERARAMPDGPWPRPLLAMQIGLLDEAAVLARIEAMRPVLRAFARAQTWFYLGQRRWQAQDLVGARQAFQRAGDGSPGSEPRATDAAIAMRYLDGDTELVRKAFATEGKGERSAALNQLRTAAEAGSVNAQISYALGLKEGWAGKPQPADALPWLERAAAQGEAYAMYLLGLAAADGLGRAKDAQVAQRWFEQAAELGQADAQYRLGRLLEAKAPAQALALYERAAVLGLATAQARLGYLYGAGKLVPKSDERAFLWDSFGAEQGDSQALHNLGWLYETGRGVEANLERAFEIYLLAAKLGYTDSQLNVGNMYQRGRGVARKPEVALDWLRKAAEGGSVEALNSIGYAYDEGLGVSKDHAAATRYYQESAAKGSAQGQYNLGYNYRYGEGIQQDFAKALEWLRRADAQNFRDATHMLGMMYRDGLGVRSDMGAARRYFERAAELGNTLAPNKLGLMYRDGLGGEVDRKLAEQWFRKGIALGDHDAKSNLAAMFAQPESSRAEKMDAARLWRAVLQASDVSPDTRDTAERGLGRLLVLLTPAEQAILKKEAQ
ncbi:DUF3857 domain-containing protein [Massilia sp. TS11]|uniref:DUF3857 domain-containing protein n=1 Tax=Massilia sp. TS11 TaxID=2908003 RepID=UPI001EDA348C|nr:DUF3857 domain-containing protein [Massilia sp. TS11]MCG2583827.1 DUF3857 domain-containing protein [Massilia sp. TS11]